MANTKTKKNVEEITDVMEVKEETVMEPAEEVEGTELVAVEKPSKLEFVKKHWKKIALGGAGALALIGGLALIFRKREGNDADNELEVDDEMLEVVKNVLADPDVTRVKLEDLDDALDTAIEVVAD